MLESKLDRLIESLFEIKCQHGHPHIPIILVGEIEI